MGGGGGGAGVGGGRGGSFVLQSTLVISKSKGPSKKVRVIRTSTYQICSIEEKQFEQPIFTNDYVI